MAKSRARGRGETEFRRLARLLTCVLAFTSFPVALRGQPAPSPEGQIVGSIVEAGSRIPVPGAEVVLESDPDAESVRMVPARTTRTGSSGRYTFDSLEPGRYRIRVERLGYRGSEFWIEVTGRSVLHRSVQLTVEPLPLEPVDVALPAPWKGLLRPGIADRVTESVRVRTPVAASWQRLDAYGIDPATIASTSTMGEPDIFRALQQLPGVSSRGDFSAGFWTRGSPWGTTQILLDGLPLFNPLHGGGLAAGVSAESLERVLLFPGVRPPSLGAGATGTLALETGRADSDGRRVMGLSTATARFHLEERVLDDRVGVSVSARRSWWDLAPLQFTAFRGTDEGEPVDYFFWDLASKIDVALTDRLHLDISGMTEQDRIFGAIPGLVEESRGEWGNRLGWMGLQWGDEEFWVGGRIGATRYALDTRPGPSGAAAIPSGPLPYLVIARADLGHDSRRVEAGGRAWAGRVTWQAGLDRIREWLDQKAVSASQRGLPGSTGAATLDRTRLWLESVVALGPVRTTVGTGFTRPDGDTGVASNWTPSVTVSWTPGPGVALEAGVGMSEQYLYPVAGLGESLGPQLSAGHLWTVATADAPPLTTVTRTGSLALDLGAGFDVTMTAYSRRTQGVWMEGLYTLHRGEPRLATTTSSTWGTERSLGVETSVQRHTGRVTGSVSYSKSAAELEGEPGVSWPPPSDRPHSLEALVFGHLFENVTLGTSMTLESGWPVVTGTPSPCAGPVCDPNQPVPLESPRVVRSANYFSLDLLLDWRFEGDRVSIGVSGAIRNLTGRDNPSAHTNGSCSGAEIFALLCSNSPTVGGFSPGLTSPTPTLSVRVVF